MTMELLSDPSSGVLLTETHADNTNWKNVKFVYVVIMNA